MSYTIKALVLELDGVFLDKHHVFPRLTSSQVGTIMNSTAWRFLDLGRITVKEACWEFGSLLNEKPSVVEEHLYQAQQSLDLNVPFLTALFKVKELHPELKVYVMSNVSREHFRMMLNRSFPSAMFHYTFISSLDGMQKPDLRYFRHVVKQTGLHPAEMVMIDSAAANICAARSVGMKSIFVRDLATKSGNTLLNIFMDPVERAYTYLRENASILHSTTDGREDIVIKDNFTQLLILELLGDEKLIYLKWPRGKRFEYSRAFGVGHSECPDGPPTNNNKIGDSEARPSSDIRYVFWQYFYENPFPESQDIPLEADTTSVGYLSLPSKYLLHGDADVDSVLDIMAGNEIDGVMKTYFSKDRPWIIPESCCNILRMFHRFGDENDPDIQKTEQFVVDCLMNNACLHGNEYYSIPESFLYFAVLLYVDCRSELRSKHVECIMKLLRERLIQRIGVETNALALALRVFACQLADVPENFYARDLKLLISLQERDGGWPAGHFRYVGVTGDRLGNRGLTTALAIRAIKHQRDVDQHLNEAGSRVLHSKYQYFHNLF
ncbi:HAD-like protein [Xylaria arbuscula]|nr:HAD-like protein [Xylaria arbuscula]